MMANTYQYNLELLRNKVYHIVLVLLVTLPTLWVLLVNMTMQGDPLEMLSIWFFLIVICGLSYQLRQISLWVAIYSLFIGLIALFAYLIHFQPAQSLVVFIPVVIPLATLLLGRRNASGLTFLVAIILFLSLSGSNEDANLAVYLLVILLSFLTSAIIIQEFYVLLTTMEDYQTYALDQMREARERRSILAKRTEQLAKSTEHLGYANRQLRIAKQKIAEAHKLKAQFAANVSHELRTPINLVVGFAETIMRFPNVYGRPLPVEYMSDIRTIYRNSKHLQNLINDVLDISQIESGHMALVKEAIAIGDVIQEAVKMLQDQIRNKGLVLKVDLPDNLPVMWLDRVRIRQVFINLLGNAIRFTDIGQISITAFEEDNNLMICVADTGVGVQEGEQENIFEEFYQTDSINRRGEGSGLGLTISRRFIGMHNGEIWAESRESGGSFWIKLPIESQKPLALTGNMRALSIEKNNVIVLNDDIRILEFFERHLNKQHVIAIQQLDAIYSYLDTNPTAIIMDKDDHDKLKTHPMLSTVESKMSIITCPMPSGRQYMRSLGVADYLVKPISAELLEQSIRQLPSTPDHILIVDDEREIVRLFGRLLKAILPDCHLTMAYTGQEALALLSDNLEPNLVILDIIMPDVDGLTVLEIIQSNPELAHIPVIIASAKGASEAIDPAIDGHLVIKKPSGFQPLELLQCIESVVSYLNPLT